MFHLKNLNRNIKIQIARKIHFCSGHRVLNHESKCANVHGHNYVGWFYARSKQLDKVGRVIDFSVIKDIIKNWIDNNWDHKMLVFEQDYELIKCIPKKSLVIVPFNPTAENMASYLLENVCRDLFCDVEIEIFKIILYETENCYAVAEI